MQYRTIRNTADIDSTDLVVNRIPAPDHLDPFIDHLWHYEVASAIEAVPVQVIPSGSCSIGFSIASYTIDSYAYGPSLSSGMRGTFTQGVEYLGAAFRPGRASRFFEVPMSDLSGKKIRFDDICPVSLDAAKNKLMESNTRAEQFAILTEFVNSLFQEQCKGPNSYLARLSGIERSVGFDNIDLPALGPSNRTARRHFLRYCGCTQQDLTRMVRLQHALALLMSQQARTVAQTACATGYFDHAHLCKEFERTLGLKPSSLIGNASDPRPASAFEHLSEYHLSPWHLL